MTTFINRLAGSEQRLRNSLHAAGAIELASLARQSASAQRAISQTAQLTAQLEQQQRRLRSTLDRLADE
jgi:hypothetical protein